MHNVRRMPRAHEEPSHQLPNKRLRLLLLEEIRHQLVDKEFANQL
jgi:hypothetical protein